MNGRAGSGGDFGRRSDRSCCMYGAVYGADVEFFKEVESGDFVVEDGEVINFDKGIDTLAIKDGAFPLTLQFPIIG